ncbi:HAD-IIIA family hydrolase [Prosthecomicrobium sp. N25]|uniref:HAD-IIIA family hydrolase n=1 Tax=Prosthecomicrobium sp. N25 TaxID=3129254 RepID=UPI00307787FD
MTRQAVVLVGGLGTRLRALGIDRPKPMLEVAGRPFVEHVIRELSAYGIDRVLLLAGYRGDLVEAHFRGRSVHGVDVEVSVEPAPLGTAGALTQVADRLDDTFLMTNGDSLFLADLAPLLAPPLVAGRAGRLLLRRIEDTARYGRVELSDDGRIAAFREKAAVAGPGLINAGLYLLRREAVLSTIDRTPSSIEQDVFPALVGCGALDGITADGFFLDIGTPESLASGERSLDAALRRPAAFLDRDGVLNIDGGYTHRVDDLRFTPTAVEAVRLLNRAGYRVVVVTNQAGVSHGYYTEGDVADFHRAMRARLLEAGARIDAFYHCPFHPEGKVPGYIGDHPDRKPGSGMIERAFADWPLDRSASFLVGDRPTDLQAAEAAGIPGFAIEPNVGDLAAVVGRILSSPQHRRAAAPC